MRKGHRHIVLPVAALLALVIPARAQTTGVGLGSWEKAQWFVDVTPYYWASRIGGSHTLGLDEAPNEAGPYLVATDQRELNTGLAARLEVGKGRWSLLSFVVSGDNSGTDTLSRVSSPPVFEDYDFGWTEVPLMVGFRVGPLVSPYLQLYGGPRWMHWSQDLTDHDGNPLGSWDESWVDWIAGAEVMIDFGARFVGTAHSDAAIFRLGCDLSWSVSAGLRYYLFGPFSLRGSYWYRQVRFDNGKEGDQHFAWRDAVVQGWLLGVGVSIPPVTQ